MSKHSIYDRNLNKSRNLEIPLSSFSYLFSEMLQYAQKKSSGVSHLEEKLSDYGHRVGIRHLELISYRERFGKRETRVLNILSFIYTTLWKSLFGKQGDSLERGTENADEYMITDNEPLLTKYISIPRESSSLNAGAFMAGIIESTLDACQFPCQVTAHSTSNDTFPIRTTFLIKFEKSVMIREQNLDAK